MSRRVIVVGAGMGGLTAALRLKQHGFEVLVLEARESAGGLASGVHIDGFSFDAGPYILLDKPGLEWILRELQLDLPVASDLIPLDPVYEVNFPDGRSLSVRRSLDETAASFDASWPGAGEAYRKFVKAMLERHRALRPLLYREPPGILELGWQSWMQVPFLLRSLGSVLNAAGLRDPVKETIAIWTRISGAPISEAPAPMAFVPALFHSEGAYYLRAGIRSIADTLAAEAARAGIEFRYRTKVKSIYGRNGRVEGVETEAGERLACKTVLSDAHGIGTYLDLARETPDAAKQKLSRLPLQSPGVCAYLAVRRSEKMPYLRFFLPRDGQPCRLFVSPGNLSDGGFAEWQPARLLAPGPPENAPGLLEDSRWREGIAEYRVLKTRGPAEWGREYHLYRDSMNPVMTASFMRSGRIGHRSPWIRGLYLAGSSTHPGQWITFCGISGILAADCLRKDMP